jgi:hypothetical protein
VRKERMRRRLAWSLAGLALVDGAAQLDAALLDGKLALVIGGAIQPESTSVWPPCRDSR